MKQLFLLLVFIMGVNFADAKPKDRTVNGIRDHKYGKCHITKANHKSWKKGRW